MRQPIKGNEKNKGKIFQKMMSKFLRITPVVTVAILLLSLNFSCSGKEAVEDTSRPKKEGPEPDGKDTESWAYWRNDLTGRRPVMVCSPIIGICLWKIMKITKRLFLMSSIQRQELRVPVM